LKEYYNLVKCNDNTPDIDPSKMSKEYIDKLELRHEENRKKRIEKSLTASPEEFING